jgi:hypothetical protein
MKILTVRKWLALAVAGAFSFHMLVAPPDASAKWRDESNKLDSGKSDSGTKVLISVAAVIAVVGIVYAIVKANKNKKAEPEQMGVSTGEVSDSVFSSSLQREIPSRHGIDVSVVLFAGQGPTLAMPAIRSEGGSLLNQSDGTFHLKLNDLSSRGTGSETERYSSGMQGIGIRPLPEPEWTLISLPAGLSNGGVGPQ